MSRDGSRYVHGECNVAQHDSASPSKDENREKMKKPKGFQKVSIMFWVLYQSKIKNEYNLII